MTDILEHPPPVSLGSCSYSLHLAHHPIGWIPLRQAMSARLHRWLHRWRRDAGDSLGG
jgi:hypothetical protein